MATNGERTAYRTCPLCEATCGLELTLHDDRIVSIRGDADDVFSRGFVCPKGASGLAPSISRWAVRSTSGTGTVVPVPNISAEASCLGVWSTVEAENTLRVDRERSSSLLYVRLERLWALGLPR